VGNELFDIIGGKAFEHFLLLVWRGVDEFVYFGFVHSAVCILVSCHIIAGSGLVVSCLVSGEEGVASLVEEGVVGGSSLASLGEEVVGGPSCGVAALGEEVVGSGLIGVSEEIVGGGVGIGGLILVVSEEGVGLLGVVGCCVAEDIVCWSIGAKILGSLLLSSSEDVVGWVLGFVSEEVALVVVLVVLVVAEEIGACVVIHIFYNSQLLQMASIY
jgi:hypothetical protein